MTSSIAIIGPDGAGKTTITELLVMSQRERFKYVYMGVNLNACNHALPTVRWVRRIKQWLDGRTGSPSKGGTRRSFRNAGQSLRRGKLWAAARLVNTLADLWYRQLVSWYYQWRGYVVLYDRHFVFDFWDDLSSSHPQSLSQRIHGWCLKRLYPRPDLAILLDAPPEVLYARKPEWTLECLEKKRRALLGLETQMPNFHRIDATAPLDVVFEQVVETIGQFCGYGKPGFAVRDSGEIRTPRTERRAPSPESRVCSGK